MYIFVVSQVRWDGDCPKKAKVKLPFLAPRWRLSCQSISDSLSCSCVPGRYLGRD